MKQDISTRKDIEKLVDHFYEKVKKNQQISRYFTEVMKVNWEKHLPRMYDFWSNVLFYTGEYSGNPMQTHINIHGKSTFVPGDFTAWIKLFGEAVDDLYAGENAEAIKMRAQNIATIMQLKVFQKK